MVGFLFTFDINMFVVLTGLDVHLLLGGQKKVVVESFLHKFNLSFIVFPGTLDTVVGLHVPDLAAISVDFYRNVIIILHQIDHERLLERS